MAQVFIKQRPEPIVVSSERAKNLKLLWIGDEEKNIAPAPASTVIDLEEETFLISDIKRISIPSESAVSVYDPEKEEREKEQERLRLLKIPVETRAKSLNLFNMRWFMKSRMREKEAPLNVQERAILAQLDYLKKNPEVPYAPAEVTNPIIDQYSPSVSSDSSSTT